MATSINTAEIPVSIVASATAASYTVPSDRYAIVRGQVKAGGTLSIGGVVVLGSDTWAVITSSNGLWRMPGQAAALPGGTSAYTNGAMITGDRAVGGSGTTIAAWATQGIANANGAFTSYTGTVNAVAVFSNDTARTSDAATFKVPAGTVIVGAGDSRYMIELYRIPGSAT